MRFTLRVIGLLIALSALVLVQFDAAASRAVAAAAAAAWSSQDVSAPEPARPSSRRRTPRPTPARPTHAPVDFPALIQTLPAVALPSQMTNQPRRTEQQPRRGILFIKIPKTGGTVISDMLHIYANETGMRVSNPEVTTHKKSLATCDGSEDAKHEDWKAFIKHQGQKLEILASHACMNEFMRDKRSWMGDRRPLLLTLLRSPWSQFISKYRYTRYCCEVDHKAWCTDLCAKLTQPMHLVEFAQYACAANNNMRCNIQRKYLGNLGVLGDVDSQVAAYDLILILERIEESLVLMHFLFDVPFHILVHVRTNVNNDSPYPRFPHGFRTDFLKAEANIDGNIYRHANQTLTDKINALPAQHASMFPQAVKLLKRLNVLADRQCSVQCAKSNPLEPKSVKCLKACLMQFQTQLPRL